MMIPAQNFLKRLTMHIFHYLTLVVSVALNGIPHFLHRDMLFFDFPNSYHCEASLRTPQLCIVRGIIRPIHCFSSRYIFYLPKKGGSCFVLYWQRQTLFKHSCVSPDIICLAEGPHQVDLVCFFCHWLVF